MVNVADDQQLRTGIEAVDQHWNGFFRGGSYMLYGQASSGRTLLPLLFARTGVERGETCLFISPGRPRDLKIQAASLGFDLQQAYETEQVRLMRIPSSFNLREAGDDGLAKAMHDLVAVIRHRPDRLIINDFAPFVQFSSFDRFRAEFVQLLEQIDELNTTLMLVMAEPANEQSQRVIEFMRGEMTGTLHLQVEGERESTMRRLTLMPNVGHINRRATEELDLEALMEHGRPPVEAQEAAQPEALPEAVPLRRRVAARPTDRRPALPMAPASVSLADASQPRPPEPAAAPEPETAPAAAVPATDVHATDVHATKEAPHTVLAQALRRHGQQLPRKPRVVTTALLDALDAAAGHAERERREDASILLEAVRNQFDDLPLPAHIEADALLSSLDETLRRATQPASSAPQSDWGGDGTPVAVLAAALQRKLQSAPLEARVEAQALLDTLRRRLHRTADPADVDAQPLLQALTAKFNHLQLGQRIEAQALLEALRRELDGAAQRQVPSQPEPKQQPEPTPAPEPAPEAVRAEAPEPIAAPEPAAPKPKTGSRAAFHARLQELFEERDLDETPFLLLAMRLDDQDAQDHDFGLLAELVRETLGRDDALYADERTARLVVSLADSDADEAQRFFARVKRQLEGELPSSEADALLHAVSTIVVPEGRPFQNADDFLAYALD